jgi:hypothetical protein
VISFGIGRTNEERVEHELFDDADAWTNSDIRDVPQGVFRITRPNGRGGGCTQQQEEHDLCHDASPQLKTFGVVLVADFG